MEGKKSYFAVILVQVLYAGMVLFMKVTFDGGMNAFVFTFYRQAAATFILAPFAIFLEWKSAPPMTILTFCKMFFLSFGITMSLDICGAALVYTSATLVAATTNSLPVITFILAVLLRLEVLRLKTVPGIAKVIGMVFCIGGIMNLAFVKGPHFKIPLQHNPFGHSHIQHHHHANSTNAWVKGCFLLLLANTIWGLWIVLQGQVTKIYPPKLMFTALQNLFSSVQTLIIAIAMERDPSQWKLGWDFRLLAIAYCGFVVSGVTYYLQTWVIEKKGPVFPSMFTPLSLIITIFSSAILLGDTVSFGSLLGGLLLIGGLYSVLWAKGKEEQIDEITELGEVQEECSELKEIETIKPSPSLFGVRQST